jgi:hypothetical protein
MCLNKLKFKNFSELLFRAMHKCRNGFLALLILLHGCNKVEYDYEGRTLDEFTEVYNLQKTDFEKTRMLRNLVAGSFSVVPPGHQLFTNDFSNETDFESYFTALANVKAENLGTSCGPLSRIFMELLTSKGYKAFTYNFGIPNTIYTHELVLVEIQDEQGVKKIIVQDPTYSSTIVDENGNPVDFRLFLRKISQNEFSHYRIESDSVPSHVVLPKWGQATEDCELKRKNNLKRRGFLNPDTLSYISGFRNFWFMNSDPCGYFYDSTIISNNRILKEQAFFKLMNSRVSQMNGKGVFEMQNQLDLIISGNKRQ